MDFWDFHTHQTGKANSIQNAGLDTLANHQACSLGIHPWFLEEGWEDIFEEISKQVQQNTSILAIGECGFDRLKGPALELQKSAFRAQAKLAHELGVPLILHCVKGHDLFLEFLKKEKSLPNILWHGWNLKPELGQALLDYPVYFSFGKHLLLPSSHAAEWLKRVPLDRVFLETDDSKIEIAQIYQAASLILGLPLDRIDQQVRDNWNKISSRKIK
ncbi:TatD family hydrolase [Algoriphagus mannitolivorans]|uniref:TatD family hydrolase n=1 Tax=Algoriphagus mannitolivorans TaxID=226504 RepID=UPI0003F54F1D|nr:TatD family hydrolase [Algoriphagus mannitolivorans]